MYYQLLQGLFYEEMECERPQALDPALCMKLADECEMPPEQVSSVRFSIRVGCLKRDYMSISNVGIGILCSQRFIAVLTQASVPFTAYPAELVLKETGESLDARYFFWLPQRLTNVIDWERSELRTNRVGRRIIVNLILTPECEAAAPLLFHIRGKGRFLIHASLREMVEEAGIEDVLFAPLDMASSPYAGVTKEELEAYLQEHPDDWRTWCKLSECLASLYHEQAALEVLAYVLQQSPNFAFAWYSRGRILHRLGRLQEAREALLQAREREPVRELYTGFEYAAVVRELGDRDEALAHGEWMARTWPHSPISWYEVASAYASFGRHDEALQSLEKGIVLGGGARHDDLYRLKADMLFEKGRYEDALHTYEIRISDSLQKSLLWAGKARTLRALGRQQEAEQAEQEIERLQHMREEEMKKIPR